jgi:hypothetical protein
VLTLLLVARADLVVQGAVFDGLIGPVRPSPRNAWIVLLGYAAFVGCARRFWRGRGVQVVCAVRVGGEAVPAPGPAAPAPTNVRCARSLVGRARGAGVWLVGVAAHRRVRGLEPWTHPQNCAGQVRVIMNLTISLFVILIL